MAFGSRVAEELIYGKDAVTTGATNDIQQATNLARKMVTEFGFSDKLGPLRYEDNQEEVFLGHSVTQHKNVSDKTAETIDSEVRRLVEEGEATAREYLTTHMDELHTLANALLEYETLSASEVDQLLRGEKIERPDESEDAQAAREAGRPRRTSVPTSHRPATDGGMAPAPQT